MLFRSKTKSPVPNPAATTPPATIPDVPLPPANVPTPAPAPEAPLTGFHIQTETGPIVENADAAVLRDVLTTVSRSSEYFIVADGSDLSGMTYMQGFTDNQGASWHLEYQGGSLENHWQADVQGNDVERVVGTWMTTRDARTTAWQPMSV